MTDDSLHLLVFGAHPDDCEIKAGGLAAKYVDEGHDVTFVSVTNGDAGHHEIGGVELARRRRRECAAVADRLGIEYEVLDNHDGELQPSLENRKKIIRLLRRTDPDLVLSPRPNDYHPDHRYTAILVRDAAYMVRVPNICPNTPALEADPVIAYVGDHFENPRPFDPDVVVAIDDVIDAKFDALHCHESQMYEWLPYSTGDLDDVPEDDDDRREWLQSEGLAHFAENTGINVADEYREHLRERYGDERGSQVEYAEAFQASEYGAELTDDRIEELFPH